MKKKKQIKKQMPKENTFLLELGAEEIPADYLKPASLQLQEDVKKALEEKNIGCKELVSFYTVRRFVLVIKGLDAKQKDKAYEKKGPRLDVAYKDGKINDIGRAFLNKNGVSEKDLIVKEEKGQKFMFLNVFEKGKPSKAIIAEILPDIIKSLRFPKSMTWEETHVTFARPLRWILCLFNNEVVRFKFGTVTSGNKTRLHKFEDSNKEAVVKDAASYFGIMKKYGILLSQEERKAEIEKKASRILSAMKLSILPDAGLLDKIASSVETVSVMSGEFDEKYLFLPEEVIITAMREHQRYFAVVKQCGKFTNYFVNVRDGGDENNAFVAKQHAKVLFSRLNDAEFFYREDLKQPLEEYNAKLKEAVFISGLGTMYEKIERLKMLAARAKEIFGYEDTASLQMAAYLCKADLMTNMVGEKEYAGLRGFMGGTYLKEQSAKEKIYRAVAEHYYPVMAGDRLPSTMEGLLLSVIDKIDNITGFYIAGFKPTGSKDPYAVRRQALNIIYIVMEKKLDVDLAFLVYESALAYKKQQNKDTDINEILEFFRQREINYFKDKETDYDIVSAVASGKKICVQDDYNKAKVLSLARKSEKDFNDIIFVLSRVNNILPKDFKPAAVNRDLFDAPEEKLLYENFLEKRSAVSAFLGAKQYQDCFNLIASFKPLIDAYFVKILVNADDAAKKNNRLSMLAEIKDLFFEFADFSKIVIDRK
jgi:glycyl-tRNA synthetase beta chain